MTRSTVACSIALLLSLLGASAGAQVYRCGDNKTYTDKPCHGAAEIDLRVNLLNAGPRTAPPEPPPAAAIILPDTTPKQAVPSAGSSIWQNRDSRESAHQGRTMR
ncbi:MAG: DUF4124 domain-containing protein [Comamonadaceae bacterium]|nr:MAG: DUF4124 domain-containing protein [Comamonadaceae bacterium]